MITTFRRASLLLLCALAIAPASGAAQSAAAVAARKAAKTEPKPVFLWELHSPSATVYLLGSIHVASGDMYPLDARIEQAFQKADTLVLETELDERAQTHAAALLQQAGTYPPPDSLDRHVDEATLSRLSASIATMGLPVEAFFSMRPWMVSLTLTLARLQALGYRPDLGIDQHFRAAAGGKKVVSLETVEQQVAVFGDMPEALQHSALSQTLDELDLLRDLMRRALSAWRAGDVTALESLLLQPVRKEYPELYRRLFVDRNRHMAESIDGYLKSKGTYFVVVGSGHLTGPDSVLRMLQTRGYSARQL